MQASKLLSVRIPESELRRFKSVAAMRDVSLQEAVYQALDAWSAKEAPKHRRSLDELEGLLAGADTDALKKQDRAMELAKEQRWL